MGWASGSQLADDVWLLVKKEIPASKRKKVAKKIYDRFCDEDADDWCGTTIEKDAGIEYEDEE